MKFRFGNDVIDDDAFYALIGNELFLKDGIKHCVDDATADAVRRAFTPCPETQPPQSTRGKDGGAHPSSSPQLPRQGTSPARVSKARARLPLHSS